MKSEVPWNDLESKGYVVCGSFLSPRECDFYAGACAAGQAPIDAMKGSQGSPLRDMRVAVEALSPIKQKIEATLATIRSRTTLKADLVIKRLFFATEGQGNGDMAASAARPLPSLDWHQDSDYWAQDRLNLLNFWIPVRKPDRQRSNVCLVPQDALARHPGVGGRFVGRGANWFFRSDRGTRVEDRDRGNDALLDFDLADVAVTPELSAGDLLLLRGDMIHRTQDVETNRIALSIRAAFSHSAINRNELLAGTPGKRKTILGLQEDYGCIFRCFDALHTDEITIGQLVEFANGPGNALPNTRKELRARISRPSLQG